MQESQYTVLESEKYALSSVLRQPELWLQVAQIPEVYFGRPEHAALHRHMAALHEQGLAITLPSLKDRIQEFGGAQAFEEVGGLQYLDELANRLESDPGKLTTYLDPLRRRVQRERLIALAAKGIKRANKPEEDPQEVATWLGREMFGSDIRLGGPRNTSLRARLEDEYADRGDELIDPSKSDPGIESGLYDLDEMIIGFKRKELTIIGARPGMGKTAMMTTLISNMFEDNKKILVYSLEMTWVQLLFRMIYGRKKVNSSNHRRGTMSQLETLELSAGLKEFTTDDIHIDDTPKLKIDELVARTQEKISLGFHFDVIFVDYLQLSRADGFRSRNDEVGFVTGQLRILAKQHDVPVIALSQLSRFSEKGGRKDNRPQLSDLRESGEIEQHADLVFLIHRPEYYEKEDKNEELRGKTELDVVKHRHGRTGVAKVFFQHQFTCFANRAHDVDQDQNYGFKV